jgi:spore maturation protein CgeB
VKYQLWQLCRNLMGFAWMPRLVLLCHSLRSDWNHGNAHFLRGILGEAQRRGFTVMAFEPADGWSAENLARDHGQAALDAWRTVYPALPVTVYDPARLDLEPALEGADLVLVHEWNDSDLVARIAAHRRAGGSYLLLFHDTHHRMASDPAAIGRLDLDGFDGVLAFGEALREAYLRRGWGRRVFTWHEAADLRVFRPDPEAPRRRDLVWIGNWGDEERTPACTACAIRRRRSRLLRKPASNSPAISPISACRRLLPPPA